MSTPRLAVITFVDGGPIDPGFGQGPGYGGGYPTPGPIYPGGRPDNSLPGGGYPSQGLPGLPPGAIQLPVFPWDPTKPDQGLPGGEGGQPDQGLPGSGGRPDQGLPRPGRKYIVKWLACVGLILVPDQGLPENPEPEPK